jgi:hypothetical protein
MKLENLVDYKALRQIITTAFEKRAINQRPLLVVGHQGVGKTQLIQNIAKDLNIGYIAVDACAKEPADFSGLPKDAQTETIYLRPEFLPKDGSGILHIDEINRAHPDVLQVMYTLFTNRGIGKHTLGKDWIIVCSCNPSESNEDAVYTVNEIDSALEGRFRKFGVAPDATGWLNWFESKYGVESVVYQYALSDNSVVRFDGKRGTPRDFEELEKTVLSFGLDTPSRLLSSVFTSCVGPDLSADFQAFLNLRMYCTADMILTKDWTDCKVGLERAKSEGRFDIEIVLLRTLNSMFIRKADVNTENLVKFLEYVGAERAFQFFALMQSKYDASGESNGTKRDHTIHNKIQKLIKAAKEANSKVFQWAADHEKQVASHRKAK